MFRSNKRQVIQQMRQANKVMMEAVGKAGQGVVKMNAPVDTGALRDSIQYQVDDTSIVIGSDLVSEDYPIFVEKGSSRTPAQPYIGTLLDNMNMLKSVAERNYKL